MVIMALPDELCLYDFGRSTKGASKQRRDQINAEIGNMRDLLPLPESARLRLSQLQIMSLSCVYIRKCQLLQKLFGASQFSVNTPFDFFQSLTGFLLVTTRDGKLVYISENVTEYLGHSMVDMKTQGDSIYDIIDKRDHANVQTQLLQGCATAGQSDQDVTFFCRMNMSRCLKRQTGPGDIKVMHVKGHFVSVPATEMSGEKSVFVGLCSPLITPDVKENLILNNTMVFKSVHSLDMKFLELTETGEHHLKMSNDKAFRESWYGMLHPEDLNEAREKHVQLIRSRHEMGCMMTVRMITAEGEILWVNIVMHVRQGLVPNNNDPVIVCVNQVVSEQEAYHFKIQSQLYSLHAARGPDYFCHPSYPGSASPGLEGEMYMQSYQMQMPGYFPPGMMGYPSPTGPYGNYVSPDQYPTNCSYDQPSAGMHGGDPAEKRENCARKAEHAQAVEALKRKLEENNPCRTKKGPGMTTTHNNGGYQPSAGHFGCATNGVTSSAHGFIVGGAANGYTNPTHSYSYGPSQVMASPMNGHIPDLCFSLKDKAVESGVLVAFKTSPAQTDVSRSPGLPPTPDPSPTTKDKFTIKTELTTETLPDWYLTPEASPGSPKSVTDEDVSEFAKVLGAKIEAEIFSSCQKQPALEIQKQPVLEIDPSSRKRKARDLPVMDGCMVDNFFNLFSGDKLGLRRTMMLQFPNQITPRKIPKREIPVMDAMDIEDFFRQTSPLGLATDQLDDTNDDRRLTKTTSTTSLQDQSVGSTFPLQDSPREYSPSSVESGDFLSDELSRSPGQGGSDDSRVTMTVSVTLAEPHSVDHSIGASLGLEESDELLHQLFSWVSTAEAHTAPEPNQ